MAVVSVEDFESVVDFVHWQDYEKVINVFFEEEYHVVEFWCYCGYQFVEDHVGQYWRQWAPHGCPELLMIDLTSEHEIAGV